jgi:hypothetical protein
MILGSPSRAAHAAHPRNRLTIDEVFRRAVRRRPGALALADAPNRQSFMDGAPRRFSYAEADRMVAAIAGRLRGMGLPTDAVVGIQLPNIVEQVLAMLGVLRAGMIVAPLPLLWRRADAVAALAQVGAKALITCGHVGAFNHGQLAVHVAADVFSIRYVCGFGGDLPDGVVPFDDLFEAAKLDPIPPFDPERQGNAAAHVAAITFDVGERGFVPVARNHPQLLAAALAVVLESGLARDANILSALPPSSFAGISLTLLPWLLTGGTLVLHHSFDAAVFAAQRRAERCGALILPGPLASRLAGTGAFADGTPANVIAAWRSPERLATSPTWREANAPLTDVAVFGEAALFAARRGGAGMPGEIPCGPVAVSHRGSRKVVVAELSRTEAGTVAVRGPMVAHHAFPLGIAGGHLPYLQAGPRGTIDSGYRTRAAAGGDAMTIAGPPAGIACVGGYRFALRGLQDAVGRIDNTATLVALPDPLLGQRLVGYAADPERMQAALEGIGANPLVVAAFRSRGCPAPPAEALSIA